jgi:hypothetical protein
VIHLNERRDRWIRGSDEGNIGSHADSGSVRGEQEKAWCRPSSVETILARAALESIADSACQRTPCAMTSAPTKQAPTWAQLEPRTVGDISGHLIVPAYQRGFRWGQAEVERLLEDIKLHIDEPYYLQPVVVKRVGDSYELVDGQQRLTTLLLIFAHMQSAGLRREGAAYAVTYATRSVQNLADHPDNGASSRQGWDCRGEVTSDLWCREVPLEGCAPCQGVTFGNSATTWSVSCGTANPAFTTSRSLLLS